MDKLEDPEAAKILMGLLEYVSEAEIRALGIEALRRWRQREIAATQQLRDPIERYAGAVFSLHGDLGLEMVTLLAERKGVRNVDANRLKEPFQEDAAMFRAWMSPVAEFIWWLVRAGLAVEHTYGNKSRDPSRFHARIFPTSMRMTARGVRFLEASDDNPLLPGFLDRIKLRPGSARWDDCTPFGCEGMRRPLLAASGGHSYGRRLRTHDRGSDI